ncbi:MAG: hypothetical protein AABZ63_08350, partial [Actinomycetota bacterium]
AAIIAHGSGNVLVQAQGTGVNLTANANADVQSSTGHLTLTAAHSLTLNAGADVITGGTGTVDLQAGTGSLVMSDTATVQTLDGDIRMSAGDDVLDQIVLGDVTAANGNVSLATPGSVLDAGDADAEVTALGLRVVAGKGFGLLAGNSLSQPANAIETAVTTVSILVRGSDGVNLVEADALVVGDVFSPVDGGRSVSVNTVNADGTTATNTENTQSDVVTTADNGANGSIVVRTLGGHLTLNAGTATDDLAAGAAVVAHGSGNVRLGAEGALTSFTAGAGADVRSTTGHVTLTAAASVSLNAGVDVVTGGSGTLDLAAGTGSLTMAADATLRTLNGDVRITVGDGVSDRVVLGDVVAANANVSLFTTGSVVDADGDDLDADVAANGLRVVAGKGFGLLAGNSLAQAVNAIETAVGTLSVLVRGSDGVNVLEADALVIGDVVSLVDGTKSVSVGTVNADGTTTVNTENTQSDVVTTNVNGSNGSIVVRTVSGALTLNEGTSADDLDADAAVVAHGSGNVLLQAQGAGTNLTANANADVQSTTGHLTLTAAQSLTLNASVDVSTGGTGTADLLAGAGSLVMSDTATVSTVNGDIRMGAGDDVLDQLVLGDVTAANGNVSLATPGSVLDTADADAEVTANGLRVVAGKGFGLLAGNSLAQAVNAIETAVGTLSVLVRGSDGVNVLEADALLIGDVISLTDTTRSVSVRTVNADGTTTTNTENTQSDVVTTNVFGNNGSIVVRTVNGSLTLNTGTATGDLNDAAIIAHGLGNVLLQAQGTGANLTLNANADVQSTTGHLTLTAAQHLTFSGLADVGTGGTGTVDLVAGTGSLVMADTATVQTQNCDIRIAAGDDVLDQLVLGFVWTVIGNVSLATPGSILDAGDAGLDVSAIGLRAVAGKGFGLLAGNSLGRPVDAIETFVTNLSILVRGSDGVNVLEADALAIGDVFSLTDNGRSVSVRTVNADGTTTVNGEATQSDVITTNLNGDNGSIVVRTVNGSLTLNEGTATDDLDNDAALVAHGTGNLLLQAAGAGTFLTLNVNADVQSTGGHVTLAAPAGVVLGAGVDVSTGGSGSVDLAGGSGSLVMTDTTTVSTVNGDIRISAGDDVLDQIVLGDVTASNGNVSLSTPGSILDTADADAEVTANGLRVVAGKGFGLLAGNSLAQAVNAIETAVNVLSILVRGSDGVNVLEADALVIGDVVSLVDGTRSVSVNTVNADGTTTTNTENTQSDVVTTSVNGGNGSIVLRTVNGGLTLNEGTATDDLNTDAAIIAHG